MSRPGLTTCWWKTVRVKQETFHSCCFPLSCPQSHEPVQKFIDVFSWKAPHKFDIWGLFGGSTKFPCRPGRWGHVQFLCFTFGKKRLKKIFPLQRAIRAVGRVLQSAVSCVVTHLFTGSISQAPSPLQRHYQHPAAIPTIISM